MEHWQLKQMQQLPLEVKIIKTQQRIKEWYEHFDGDVYISFSGGKDSTVLLDIARQIYPKLRAVFCDTGLEYPEIREFVKQFDNVEWLKPKMPFPEVIKKYGYPVISKEQSQYIYEYRTTQSGKLKNKRWNGSYKISEKWKYLVDAPFKISDYCCEVMKKRPFRVYEKLTTKKPIVALMAHESNQRLHRYCQSGCNAFSTTRPMSWPMAFWTEQDVLEYIQQKNINYCPVYGDIKTDICGKLYTTQEGRTGCVFCMFGVHLESYPNRFQRLYTTHPKLWQYCIYKLNLKQVLEYINIPYEPSGMSGFRGGLFKNHEYAKPVQGSPGQ